MALLGIIPLELKQRDGLVPAPHRQLVIRCDRLFVTVHRQDPDGGTVFGDLDADPAPGVHRTG